MNPKNSVFVICIKAIMYLLLCNFVTVSLRQGGGLKSTATFSRSLKQ